MILRSIGTIGLFCWVGVLSAETTRPLKPAEARGLRVWDAGYAMAGQNGLGQLRYLFDISFKNETPQEIAAVRVRPTVTRGGSVIWRGRPVRLTSFSNVNVTHLGSILPYQKTDPVSKVPMLVPAAMIRRDTVPWVELVDSETFVKPNVHDLGHLYARLGGGRAKENIQLLKQDPSLMKLRDRFGLTTTLVAFATCDPQTIRFVLAHGGNPHDHTNGGSTIMHYAALNGWPGALELARKLGAKVDQPTKQGTTPLVKAIVQGMPIAWKWLLDHGANPNGIVRGRLVAQEAIYQGQAQALADLVKAGANPRAHDPSGDGWMHYAITNDVFMDEVAKYHVPVDDRNAKTGATALMIAARNNWTSQRWLIAHGANPDLRDKQGRTAWDYARSSGDDAYLRSLVRTHG